MKLKYSAVMIAVAFIFIFAGCDESEDNPVSDAGDLQEVTIVILENNLDKRVADVHIVIDENDKLSCYTSGPGGDSGGECTFRLTKTEHTVALSKAGYTPRTTSFLVTGNMNYKYISIFNY